MYDVCVVGAGTMGSSAAYYLSKNTRLNICLLGPGKALYCHIFLYHIVNYCFKDFLYFFAVLASILDRF